MAENILTSGNSAMDIGLLRRILTYVRPYRRIFHITIGLTVLLAILSPLRPWLIQYAFDHYIVQLDTLGLKRIFLLMMALLFCEAIAQFYYTYLANWLGQTVIKDLRVDVFNHINNLKLRFFDHTPIGTLVTRVVSDIETIADIFSEGLLIIMGDLLKLTFVIGAMFYMDWRLAVISLSTVPILLFCTWLFKNAIRASFRDVRNEVAKLNAFLQEHITGMNVVQIFGKEDDEMEAFREINTRHKDANIRSVWYYSIFLPVVEVLSSISIGLLVWWGAKEAIQGEVSLGKLMAFILFIHMLFRPIRELADKFNTLQMGMVSSERVFKVLDTEEFIHDEGNKSADTVEGDISFKDVWFAYNGDDYVLKGISFDVKKGETLALVGSTGAGKSSIVNLIGRFYEYNKGEIYIDGTDIRQFSLESLRRNISVVLQDVFLFSDTIHNNITLKNAAISREAVVYAAKEIGAHDFIMNLPGNYDYNVMERGTMLSVGQRQLISFIRAYVYDPKILILDEATSSVDTESEELIRTALSRLTRNRTSIVIAHRLATIKSADHILVMDHGQIAEGGSHESLLRKNGIYRNLYEIQFKRDELI